MTMFTKMRVPYVVNTISIRHHDDYKDGIGRTYVFLHKTCNPTSLAMEAKTFQITSCVLVCSVPWT
jgi:hypothetical protein